MWVLHCGVPTSPLEPACSLQLRRPVSGACVRGSRGTAVAIAGVAGVTVGLVVQAPTALG